MIWTRKYVRYQRKQLHTFLHKYFSFHPLQAILLAFSNYKQLRLQKYKTILNISNFAVFFSNINRTSQHNHVIDIITLTHTDTINH